MAKRGKSTNRKKRRQAKKSQNAWSNAQGDEWDWFEHPGLSDDDDDRRDLPRPWKAEIRREQERKESFVHEACLEERILEKRPDEGVDEDWECDDEDGDAEPPWGAAQEALWEAERRRQVEFDEALEREGRRNLPKARFPTNRMTFSDVSELTQEWDEGANCGF